MNKTQLTALGLTFLIFGGLALYLFGPPDINWDYFKSKTPNKTSKNTTKKSSKSNELSTGQVIDKYKGVKVFYNGKVSNVSGRNTTSDGYNLGLKYQCVEFAKRFYYEVYDHKMPDSYGHARDFFNRSLADGELNTKRNMYQFKNGSDHKPKADDMVVIGPLSYNKFGHLFVITKVGKKSISFVQQNPGSNNPSRGEYPLHFKNGKWTIEAPGLLGWLRIS